MDGGVRRDAGEEGDLVGADAEGSSHGGIELGHGPTPQRLDPVVERPHSLHGAVGDPLGQRSVAGIEATGSGGERSVGVGVLLEHASYDLVGSPSSRRHAHRSPRRNAS
ncbi:MAG: hypothetical protein C4306_11065 [Thermoleophilia bacterium]